MSIDLEDWILAEGKDPTEFVTTPRWIGSVRFTAGAIRAEGCRVGWDPIDRDGSLPGNRFHGEVWDIDKPRQQRLHELAQWFLPIDGVDIR